MFVTVSGAHLYGFPSADSDYELRGAHVMPAKAVLGLLLLNRNGYVLEQIYSPLIVRTSREHEELKAIAKKCITRHIGAHYLGFAKSQWRLI